MLRLNEPTPPRGQRGVSTLEIAIVVAATAIVAALGVSMYRTYSVRAQVATSVEEAAAAQHLVVAAFRKRGTPPTDAAEAGIDSSAGRFLAGSHVESLEIHNGRIELHFAASASAAIAGKTLSLVPFETADQDVVWICGNAPPGVGLEPLGFAGGAPQAAQVSTQIEERYLPPSCR